MRLDSAPESPKTYHNSELNVIRNGKGKRPEGYVEPPLSQLAKLRRQPEEGRLEAEEERLTAALEAAFPEPVRRQEPAPEGQPAKRSGASRRRRRNRGEGGGEGQPAARETGKAAPQPQEGAGEKKEEGERKAPRRRRRHRSKGGGGKPAAPQGED